jgi:hypothetical protein
LRGGRGLGRGRMLRITIQCPKNSYAETLTSNEVGEASGRKASLDEVMRVNSNPEISVFIEKKRLELTLSGLL